MSPFKKRWFHAGVVALIGALTDLSAQLVNGTVDVKRTVVVGLVIGAVSRVAGAIISNIDLDGDGNPG